MREIYKDDTMHVLECEPQCRTVRIHSGIRIRKYYLSFPYIQFTAILRQEYEDPVGLFGEPAPPSGGSLLKSFHATFTNKPLRSINYPVSLPLLPSIYPQTSLYTEMTCQVCLPIYCEHNIVSIQDMISSFWQSNFSHNDSWQGAYSLRDTPLKTYLIWSEKTQKDPSFITKVKWPHKNKISNFPKLSYRDYCCVRLP